MELSMVQMQEYTTSILREVAAICEREHIPYIGMFGTLLGAVRHKGPIPWDYDVDIAVPVPELSRFIKAMQDKLPNDYWVDYRSGPGMKRTLARIGLRKFETEELHVDVYPIIGVPDNIELQKKLFKNIRWVIGMRAAKNYKYTGKKGLKAAFIKYGLFFITPGMLTKRYDALCNKYPYKDAKKIGCSNAATGYKRTMVKTLIEDTVLLPYDDYYIRAPRDSHTVLTILYGNYLEFPPEKERNEAINKVYTVKEINQ